MKRSLVTVPVTNTATSAQSATSATSVELFRTATYAATSASSATTALPVGDVGGFAGGAIVLVDKKAPVRIASIAGGSTTFTLSTAITYANNASVLLRNLTGESNAYATIWPTPDRASTITQPLSTDASGEARFYGPSGPVGLRVRDADNNTLRIAHDWQPEKLDWVQVSPGVDSFTAGIEEAINALPSTGGTVYLSPGTFLVEGDVLVPSNVRIIGAGVERTTVKLADGVRPSQADNLTVSLFRLQGNSDIEIGGMTLDGNVAINWTNSDTSDNLSGISFTTGSRLYFHDLRIVNMLNNGIFNSAAASSGLRSNIHVHDVFTRNTGGAGISLSGIEHSNVLRCRVEQFGLTGLILKGAGSTPITAVADRSRACIVADNTVDGSEKPTMLSNASVAALAGASAQIANFLLNVRGVEDSLFANNLLKDNQLSGAPLAALVSDRNGQDGLGSSPVDTRNLVWIGNRVELSGALAYDFAGNSTVVGGSIVDAGSTGYALAFDPSRLSHAKGFAALVCGTTVDGFSKRDDAETTNAIGGGLLSTAASPGLGTSQLDSLVVAACYARKATTATKGTGPALQIASGGYSTTMSAAIAINCDMADTDDESVQVRDTSQIGKLVVRDNIGNSVGPWSGTTTLSAGVATITAADNDANAQWHSCTNLRFHASRTSPGASTRLGELEAEYATSGTGAVLTLRSKTRTLTSVTETGDASVVIWECIGDPT